MSAETHALWAWNVHYEAWLAVAQGTAAEMHEGAERRYATSRRLELAGSAFTVARRGVVPAGSPETLCVEIVPAAPEPESQPGTPATHECDELRELKAAVIEYFRCADGAGTIREKRKWRDHIAQLVNGDTTGET
jgi:hypothetical protein